MASMAPTTLRMDRETIGELRERGEVAAVARRMIERYLYLLDSARADVGRILTSEEASYVCMCLQHTAESRPRQAALVWTEIEHAIVHEGARPALDTAALIATLRSLTPVQSLLIADAAERYWDLAARGRLIMDDIMVTGASLLGCRGPVPAVSSSADVDAFESLEGDTP